MRTRKQHRWYHQLLRIPGAVIISFIVLGCAPAASQTTLSQPVAGSVPSEPPRPRRATLAIGAEVNYLASKLEAANTYSAEINFLINSPLVVLDPKGRPHPLLAAELPSRDNGTWTVNPDGTMETLWKIRPNARWHDGEPVTSRDFVFALRLYRDDAIPSRDRLPERYMSRIEPRDDTSFTIYWSQPYPWANQLALTQLEPLPEHILGRQYEAGDTDAFVKSSFWSSTAYVGSGPFRLTQWDPGAQMVFQAFPDFFLGKPGLDEIVVKVIGDSNTVVANVLSGTVDATLGTTLEQQGAATIREQWASSGGGMLAITPTNFRHLRFQNDATRNRQPALLELRVRQALFHAIDRERLIATVSNGTSGTSDIPFSPSDPVYQPAMQVIAKYPYDPARALALLQEVGWTRTGDGPLMNAAGERFVSDLRESQGPDTEAEGNIVISDLSKLGMEVKLELVPESRIRDLEYRATFPGMASGSLPVGVPRGLELGTSEQCASAERRYAGTNRGCWTNPEYDRLYRVITTTLDPAERTSAAVDAMKILTENVGVIGLGFQVQSLAVRKGLVGPTPRWASQSGSTFNVYEWHWE